MSKVILSICIPTYDRPNRISLLISQIISIQSNEIEVVIVDDNPLNKRTEEVIRRFKDPRIQYFRNKKNLGYDANVLKTINKAKGEFIFLLMDDDDIIPETIPFIIKTIKETDEITHIFGHLSDDRASSGYHYSKTKYTEKIFKRGQESLENLLFFYSHASGLVIRRDILDLQKALKYIGSLYIQEALVAQALIKGDTIRLSKVFVHCLSDAEGSDQILIKGKKHWHPTGKINVYKYRIKILYDIVKDLENGESVKKIILNRMLDKLYDSLYSSLVDKDYKYYINIKAFLDSLSIISQIDKIARKPSFWVRLLYEMIKKLVTNL